MITTKCWFYSHDPDELAEGIRRGYQRLKDEGDRMTDYIVTCDEETASWIGDDVDSMRPIVRCRDCKLFNEYHGKCHRQSGVLIDGNSTRLLEDLGDVLVLADAEPDGFCKWAKRRSQ